MEQPKETMAEPKQIDVSEPEEIKQKRLRDNAIYLLPNAFTIAALFAAFQAIILATVHDQFEMAAIYVFASMILDGMDGRVARMTNSQSAFGEQMDSLADMVSFGVAPALIAYKWQLHEFGHLGLAIAFIYCACAGLRLALFNTMIGKADKRWFVGIPSPTAAALIAGLVWVHHGFESIPGIAYLCLALTLFAGLSMIVQIPFWSFKEFGPLRQEPYWAMLLIVCIILLIWWKPALVLFLMFLAYSCSGYVVWILKRMKKKSTTPSAV